LAIFICLDNVSMDIIYYDIFPKENYQYWKIFLLKLKTIININGTVANETINCYLKIDFLSTKY